VREIREAVKNAACKKDNCFIWEEFCDFFFLKDASMSERLDPAECFWRKIGAPEEEEGSDAEDEENNTKKEPKVRMAGAPKYNAFPFEERKEVEMTPAL
jgi:hypothetical protein